MTDLSFSLPDDLARKLENRLADGHYTSAGDYFTELVRRDLAEAADTAWVREKIAEGLASGFMEKDAREVLKDVIEERHARRG